MQLQQSYSLDQYQSAYHQNILITHKKNLVDGTPYDDVITVFQQRQPLYSIRVKPDDNLYIHLHSKEHDTNLVRVYEESVDAAFNLLPAIQTLNVNEMDIVVDAKKLSPSENLRLFGPILALTNIAHSGKHHYIARNQK